MNDKTFGILLLIIAILLLGVSFYINASGTLDFLNTSTFGDGLGALCDSEDECREFCQSNRGRCDDYCRDNLENDLCSGLFGRAGQG